MRASDYAELRDAWASTLRDLRAVALDFEEVPRESADESTHDALDRFGYWITSDELYHLEYAIDTLEGMIGRAHERATGALSNLD